MFKSSSVQFWPILGMLQGFIKRPVLIAMFCGESKPTSLSDYLGALVNELKVLKEVSSLVKRLSMCKLVQLYVMPLHELLLKWSRVTLDTQDVISVLSQVLTVTHDIPRKTCSSQDR